MEPKDCAAIVFPGDDRVTLTNYNTTVGSYVVVGCKTFGHRVVGSRNLTCLATGEWSDTTTPSCQWTWELSTHEKLVLGTSIAAGAFLLLVVMVILIAYCCSRENQRDSRRAFCSVHEDRVAPAKKHDFDNYGPVIIEGGPGIYPDAYYAYQEYGDTKGYPPDMPGMDRPWLGYIPRPKIADGRYYH